MKVFKILCRPKVLAFFGLLCFLAVTVGGLMRLYSYSLPMWMGNYQEAGTPASNPNLLNPDAPPSPLVDVDTGWFDRTVVGTIEAAQLAQDKLSGDRSEAMYNLGVQRYQDHDYKGAQHAFDKAFAACSSEQGVVPSSKRKFAAQCQFMIGNACANSDKTPQAVAAYELALRLDPTHIYATYNLERLQDSQKSKGEGGKNGDKPAGPTKRI